MSEDYNFMVTVKVWADICQGKLDYEDLTDGEILVTAIERDLALVILHDAVGELCAVETEPIQLPSSK